MRLLIRLLQRILILTLGIVSVWLIVFVFFEFEDHRLPWVLAYSDTNAERDYIIGELMNHRVVEAVTSYQPGQRLPVERVNHYVTDGEVTFASLRANVS